MGTGPEHSPSPQLDLQQQQPRSAGGSVRRLSFGNHQTITTNTDCMKILYMVGLLSSLVRYYILWCSLDFTYCTCDVVVPSILDKSFLLYTEKVNLDLFYAFFSSSLQGETRNQVFAEKLETLLHRAYHLQEDFGSSIPTDSVLADFGESHDELMFDLKRQQECY